MTTENLIVSREYSRLILRLIPFTVANGLYAIVKGHSYLALAPLSIASTTYLYWYKPSYSWRRYLDIITVLSMCSYQAYRALNSDYTYSYISLNIIAIISYITGLHYHYNRKEMYLGMVFHSGVHIFLNMACTILYSGNIY